MENAIELPLEEEGMYTVIEAVATAMTYEVTLALMYTLGEMDINDELKSASSLFDRITWFTRTAYITGFVDGIEMYDDATYEGELYIGSINAKVEEMISEEYGETIMRIGDHLNLLGDIHPVPRVASEAEELLISPRRITRRMGDGRITVRLDGEACLEKLWRYEDTGFEPEDMLRKEYRPHMDMMEYYEGEPPTGEVAESLLIVQNLLDSVYEYAYAKGRKAERETSAASCSKNDASVPDGQILSNT